VAFCLKLLADWLQAKLLCRHFIEMPTDAGQSVRIEKGKSLHFGVRHVEKRVSMM